MEDTKITPATEVSTTELACVLGLTGRRIRQMAEDGQIEKVAKGQFLLCDCVQRYIASQSTEDQRLDRARRAAEVTLRSSKAQIAKMEADELKGKMHRSEDVAAMTEDLIYTIRSALISLPGRLAVDVTGAATSAEVAEIIRREVYQVMRELSCYQYDPEKYQERVRERRKWSSQATDEDSISGGL